MSDTLTPAKAEDDAAFVERMASPFNVFVAAQSGVKEADVDFKRLVALARRAVTAPEVRLRVGELSASEMRAVRAYLDAMGREVLAAIRSERPDSAGEGVACR